MNKIKSIFFGTLFIISSNLVGQQVQPTLLYDYNPYRINEGYSFLNEGARIFASGLKQWTGVQNSPLTALLNGSYKVHKSIALGGDVFFRKEHLLQEIKGSLSITYGAKIGNKSHLAFSLTGGVFQSTFTPSKATVIDESDNVVLNGNQSGVAFYNSFSVLFRTHQFTIGLRIPNTIETATNSSKSKSYSYQLQRHYQVYSTYEFTLSNSFDLIPSVLYQTFNFNQHQVDINLNAKWKKQYHFGLGYRLNGGVLARAGFEIKNKYIVSYGYETPLANLSRYSGGTHEFSLGIKLTKRKKVKPIEPKIVEKPIEEPKEELVAEEVKEEPIQTPDTTQNEELEVLQIGYEFDQVKLSETNKIKLNEYVSFMKENPNKKLLIKGLSCNIGTKNAKQSVSERRAKAVKFYIVSKGISGSRISAIGLADTQPVAPFDTKENRAKNRAVIIEVQ